MKRRILVRLRRSLKRLELRPEVREAPVDEAWKTMLARLALEDRERRLKAAEQALNRVGL